MKDDLPICTGCGVDSPLTKSNRYGWICDDCFQEFEYCETLDIESHEQRKREQLQEKAEY